MKNLIIKIALSIIVVLSSFGMQSCQKEANITPVKAPAPIINKTIIGKWRSVIGTSTAVREFTKGVDENQGTGSIQVTTTTPGGGVTTSTEPFKWSVDGNKLHLVNSFNMIFLFQISEDGSRLIIFTDKEMKQISSTSERIK